MDNDYDDDGNNIVPCPICMSKYCPSKEDGECPDEDMFALEGEIRMLLSEYKETGDNSRIVNVLEAVEHLLTEKDQELQKVREQAYKDGARDIRDFAQVEIMKRASQLRDDITTFTSEQIQSELDQPIS
jgi:hypothetical protein